MNREAPAFVSVTSVYDDVVQDHQRARTLHSSSSLTRLTKENYRPEQPSADYAVTEESFRGEKPKSLIDNPEGVREFVAS